MMEKKILMVLILVYFGGSNISFSSDDTILNCTSSFRGVHAGIASVISEAVGKKLERKRLYDTYLAPGRMLGSPGFQYAMKHLYTKLNKQADIPLGAKEMNGSQAVKADGLMYYKVIERDPKRAAFLVLDTLHNLLYKDDLFPSGGGEKEIEHRTESLLELRRRADMIGIPVKEYIQASDEIIPVLADGNLRAELERFLVEILPVYGPIVVRQAVANETPSEGTGIFRKALTALGTVRSRFSASGDMKAYHQRWNQELKTEIDEMAREYGLSANDVEEIMQRQANLKANEAPVNLSFTVPSLNPLTASLQEVKALSKEVNAASEKFFEVLRYKVPTITEPKGWNSFAQISKRLLSDYKIASKFPITIALSELKNPLGERLRAIENQKNELNKLNDHLEQILLGMLDSQEAVLSMHQELLGHETEANVKEPSPKLVSLTLQAESLQTEIVRLKGVQTQLGGVESILISQQGAIEQMQKLLLYPENILDTHLSDASFEQLKAIHRWAERALEGQPPEPMKLIGKPMSASGD